ncbi:MAG: hypothetical protein EBT09_07120, partial [Actinobacteria bacterium]|nr:hypothetical protein [Actinomycetota bacterium]
GTAYCWGLNDTGELGDGTSGTNGPFAANRLVPVAVGGGLSFKALAAGGGHTCGLATDGRAYCWGWNSSGQLGVGPSGNWLVPVAVSLRV